jgi:hypothetical protein
VERTRLKIAVSAIITLAATRLGFESVLGALGFGPYAAHQPDEHPEERRHVVRGLQLLSVGAASLLASAMHNIIRKMAGIPILAIAMRICFRQSTRQAGRARSHLN